MTSPTPTWHTANQNHLMIELDRIAARFDEVPVDPTIDSDEITATMDAPPAIVGLCEVFGLSAFERDVVLLCAGVELDANFSERCGRTPTFSVALSRLEQPHWSALSPGGPLRRWRLVKVGDDGLLTTRPLRLDERVLHHLVGVDDDDPFIAGLVVEPESEPQLVPSHVLLANRIFAFWSLELERSGAAVVQLCGDEPRTLIDIAHVTCEEAGLTLRVAPAGGLPRSATEIDSFIRLWEREAALSSAALLIDCTGDAELDREVDAAVDRIVGGVAGIVMIASRYRRRTPPLRPVFSVDVERPTEMEQREIWKDRLGGASRELNTQVAALAAHFDLGPTAIDAACLEAQIAIAADEDQELSPDLGDVLWSACRTHARSGMASLARRIEPRASWDDLVMSEGGHKMLRAMVQHVRHRARVYGEWGFAEASSRGRGIAALFAGPSGTGKTMAAEVLAAELQLDLYSIDLSSVVSKYIGETEKNLRRVFDAAESSGAILLFDEADALFGRRSEVKDSHDRYANIEVSYLLQRVENYRGIAILTTNMKDAVDSAFLRRLSFIVDFPFPDEAMRRELWNRVFPASTPKNDLNLDRLKQLHVSGGSIKNIALAAAFRAAEEDEAVGMRHIREATVLDYSKIERHLTPAELSGWGE